MANILLFFFFCLAANDYRVDGTTLTISTTEEDEIKRHLNLINKPPIRSFQTEQGYIVDCIDIHKQPAFDHPFLKNHKLQVSPQIYHNKLTHVFVLWTSDSFRTTGCYNMMCPGFIQIDPHFTIGLPIINLSTYEGPQFEISLSISQDSQTKNWWLVAQNRHIGYFPAALFSNLSTANRVGWGGRVSGVMKGQSPPMGSGHFPDGDLTHACFIRKISYVVSDGSTEEPVQDVPKLGGDNPQCYGLKYFGFLDPQNRFTLQFGGPGGSCAI